MSTAELPLEIGFFIFGGIGRDGKPVKRTRSEYPYSFDDYLSFQSAEYTQYNGSAYSDRMSRWDGKKYTELMVKHFQSERDDWTHRSPAKIQAFLRDYFGKPDLQLVRVYTCCNSANGFEAWQFLWLDTADKTSTAPLDSE